MRLISLGASSESFKTVIFNKTGPSFILAKQNNPEQFDKSKTYNGVGKSLLISLIDFCLGAKKSSKIAKSLKSNLHDWHFILKIEISDQCFTIIRYTNDPNIIYLNEEKLKISVFCERLEKLCFDIPKKIKYLTFRSLLPFFIRPSKQSYNSYDKPIKDGTPYQVQLYNAFLLGLDVALAQTKKELREEIEETGKLHKSIKDDSILRQFFDGYKDSSLAIADLNRKIEGLEIDLKKFEVADDYYQIKQKSDDIKNNLDQIQNRIELKKVNLENINNSLKVKPDISREQIKEIYNESKIVFQTGVERKLSELEKFYEDLTINRKRRLIEQKNSINNDLKGLEEQFHALKRDFDDNMKFLNAHHALDVFTKMNNRLSEFIKNREKLQDYERLQNEYEQKKTSLGKKMIMESEKTSSYLKEIKKDIDNIMKNFMSLVISFYPNARAGITVHNNDRQSQIRYDIDAKIESDSSDGIKSVKLFCYDLTLLKLHYNHSICFIFHDSRLFNDIDEVHCNIFFQTIKSKFISSDKQYIASLNQNQLNDLSSEMQSFVNENVILELTDNSDSGKLLGQTVELEYD